MHISYLVPTCYKLDETKRLVSHLLEHKRDLDEIVVGFDTGAGTDEVREYLESVEDITFFINPLLHNGKKDFSHMKNSLKDKAINEWCWQIDDDEIPPVTMMRKVEDIINAEANIDAIYSCRANIILCDSVEVFDKMNAITSFKPQGWVEGKGMLIGWPSRGIRIFKNIDYISWHKPLHESLEGYRSASSSLPAKREYALEHDKTPELQHKQHWFYHDECGQRIGTEHLRGTDHDFSKSQV